MTFNNIRPGDIVTILVPNGKNLDGGESWKKAKGRCVMTFPTHAVLNMGGAHGTPGIANEGNYLVHRKGRS